MERKDIKKKYKWNINALLKNKNYSEYEKEIKTLTNNILVLKGKISNSEENFSKFLEFNKKRSIIIGQMFCFFYNKTSENVMNQSNNALLFKFKKFINENNIKLFWVENEIIHSTKEIKKLLTIPKFSVYKNYFLKIFRTKPYVLDLKSEKLISKLSICFGGHADNFSLLTNADFSFGYVRDSKNNKKLLTQGNYRKLFTSNDLILRKNTYLRFWKIYLDHKNILSNLYYRNVIISNNISKIYNYKNALNSELFADNVNEEFYTNLLDFSKKYSYLTTEYLEIKRKILKTKKTEPWILSKPLFPKDDKKYTIEGAQKIIFNALSVLGPDYRKKIHYIFDNSTIDYLPNKGKRTGAYSYSAWDSAPYICMNWCGKYSDLSTLIHELGHSVHSLFSNEKQIFEYSNYPIFLAEIASIVNEMLLVNYFLRQNKKNKKTILNEVIKEFIATVFRQLQFAEYEMWAHNFVADGNVLNYDVISKKCNELNKIYFPRKSEDRYSDDYSGLWGIYVPHFYSDYYVYKYAIGMICAAAIVNNINNDKNYYKKYLYFLSSGCSEFPVDILKKIGIDLTKNKTYENAFLLLKSYIKELKKII